MAAAVDFSTWFATDYEWPKDGERGIETHKNQAKLRALGVVVSEERVDAMNVGAFLRSNGIDADEVVLAVLNGMCSRVGANNNECRKTSGELGVPFWAGPIELAFAGLTAALPQATVVVTATGCGKQYSIAKLRIRQSMTRPVLCREVQYPAPVQGVCYKPESNGLKYRMVQDPIPLGIIAVGPAIGVAADCFGNEKGSRTMHAGPLVLQAVAAGGILLFLGEFTCTSVLHLANYAAEQLTQRSMRAAVVPRPLSGTKLPRERMRWGDTLYDYDETVAHCAEKLLQNADRAGATHVGLHAAQLWLCKAHALQITNFRSGAAWFPAGGSLAVRDRCVVL